MDAKVPELPPPPNFANAQTIDYILYILITVLTLILPMFGKKVYKMISQCTHRTKTTNDLYKIAKEGVSDSLRQRSHVASIETTIKSLVDKVDEQLTRSDIVEAAAELVRHSDNTPEDIKRSITRERLSQFIREYNKQSKSRSNTVN